MSRSAVSGYLEGIDRVGRRRGTDIGFQGVTADDIHGFREKTSDVFFEPDIVINTDPRGRIDLYHDIDIAVGAVVAPRHRAKQRGTAHAARAKGGFRISKNGERFVASHAFN